MSTERAHHPYSPSSLEMLEACPCYRNRNEVNQHERTIAGTKAHAVAESGKDDATLGDDDAEAVADCLDLIDRRKRAMIDLARENGQGSCEIRIFKENYWPVDQRNFLDTDTTTGGYADEVLVCGEAAEIFDWKFGKWAVTDASVNLQGIAYALGVFHRFPDVRVATVWFNQPHLNLTTSATFKRDQVPELYLRVQTVVARARDARLRGDFSTATPKVPACNFCANLGICPKVAAFACKVGHKFFPLEIPDNISPTQLLNSRDASLGLRLASVVKIWAESFRAQVTNRVLDGRADVPEGYTVENKRGEREIIDMGKLKATALQYLTEEEYATTLSTTFGALEKLINEKAPRGQKKAALQDFKTKLEEVGATAKGEPYSYLKVKNSR